MKLSSSAVKIDLENSTVDFYKFEENGIIFYYFDTSEFAPPAPMVNAMAGLKLIDSEEKKLIMINHKEPVGLFPRIENSFDFEISKLENGNFKIVFGYKAGLSEKADLTNTSCGGGCS